MLLYEYKLKPIIVGGVISVEDRAPAMSRQRMDKILPIDESLQSWNPL